MPCLQMSSESNFRRTSISAYVRPCVGQEFVKDSQWWCKYETISFLPIIPSSCAGTANPIPCSSVTSWADFIIYNPFFFFFFAFSRASPTAYGGSQARGRIGAVATSLCQSHSNTGSEPHLQPTPQLTATPDP